ncbi:unnamed protein product [Brassica napus]|uniref:(rape) hypothetical protein n=1 Tax=Brassica napus TaxID=3708 RepID=A0A816VCN7_BRANA|nr:unnamed protein product [Brassica napus]
MIQPLHLFFFSTFVFQCFVKLFSILAFMGKILISSISG